MRRGLTLIELVFTIVIISTLLMIIPKLISVSNRSMELGIKEEALFDAISLTYLIKKLPWDQNTTNTNGAILKTGMNDCNKSTGYRIGGFTGSRNCINAPDATPYDKANGGCNDIDDFNDPSCYEDNTTNGLMEYHLDVNVSVENDNNNSKVIWIDINSSNPRIGKFKSHFFYKSYNLGWIEINRRSWK